MAKREKKVIITGVTREVADEAFAVYAKADAQSAKITAEIELQCAKIREKYASKLAELEDEKAKAFDTLQAYATENQTEPYQYPETENTEGLYLGERITAGKRVPSRICATDRGDSQGQAAR